MQQYDRAGHLVLRTASEADVPQMAACRLTDPEAGPADSRMTAYFRGQHHPQLALMPRTGYVAVVSETIIGYIAGHLTTRHQCQGEVQYLFVAPAFRRRGVGTSLVRQLARWFQDHDAVKVCVCVDPESPAARPFYAHLGASPLSPQKKYWYVWENVGALESL